MLSGARRYLLIVVLLAAAAGLMWAQQRDLAARATAKLPRPALTTPRTAVAQAQGTSSPPEPGYVYFVDIEGWYRITPYETVVRSPYDLAASTSEEMARTLPTVVGEWRQAGPDRYTADEPSVVEFLGHPTIALERTYQDASGQTLTLGLVGNVGDESFLLFSHTPETCYPGRLWNVVEKRRETVPLVGGMMYAQYLLTQQRDTGQRLMVLYWYLWDDPQRDSREGVLSVRVNLVLPPGASEESVLERARGFVRALFPSVYPWQRF